MYPRLKTKRQTIKVNRNGYTFQLDPENPSMRFDIFGDSGGTDITTVDPWKGTGMREMFKKYTDWLQPYVGGVSAYPGQITPGASGLQQAGFGAAAGLTPMATGAQQYFGDISGTMDVGQAGRAQQTAEQALSNVLAPYDPEMAMQAVEPARQLALDTYFRDIVPQLKESYVSRAGTADAGALNRALAREGSRLSMGLNAQLAPYLYSGSEAQKNRQVTGVNQAMNLAQLPGSVMGQATQVGGMGTDILSQMLNMGSMQRGITGEQMAEPYGKWAFEQPWANPYADLIKKLVGSAPQYGYIGAEQGPSLGSQLLPVAGQYFGTESGSKSSLLTSGISGLLGLLSDVRFKENIESIENALEKVNKLEGKTYNFKGTPDRRDGGIIAQDLERVMPEAVLEQQGVKYVKLDAIVGLLLNAINELSEEVADIKHRASSFIGA